MRDHDLCVCLNFIRATRIERSKKENDEKEKREKGEKRKGQKITNKTRAVHE
jgi:hypothetical protein